MEVNPIKEPWYVEYNRRLFQRDMIPEMRKRQVKDKIRGFEVVSRCKENGVILPKRSTSFSAGYDFYAFQDIKIPSSLYTKTVVNGLMEEYQNKKLVPFLLMTGVKAYMQKDEVLMLYNRSSNPKKLGLVLANSVGVVDSDYYNNPDNEGEIGFMFYNMDSYPVVIKKGQKIGQGIFQKWFLADNDNAVESRSGGFGSTGK